jgi:8-amino-7-oxononanoate synthase
MGPLRPESHLAELERQHLRRRRRTVETYAEERGATHVRVAGRRLVNFCGNDYLGLARHPELTAAMSDCARRWGVGSGASHLVSGHGAEHAQLERELAEFVARERALLFSTGYMANLAVITACAGRGDLVLLDRLSHASLIDGALLSRSRLRRYAHADAGSAERLLAADRSRDARIERARLIATDGLFSMDGDLAPVAALAACAQEHGATLIVDDAHGLGVLGASGRGTLEELAVPPQVVPLLVGTLGKAFGTFGAFVAGSDALIELLLQRARPYVYTTALPHAVAAAARAALELARREPWRRERVRSLTVRLRRAAAARGVALGASESPIQPILLGSAPAALAASRALESAGFWVAAIRPPTVPRDASRLRITLSADHTEAEVDGLVDALAGALEEAASLTQAHTDARAGALPR